MITLIDEEILALINRRQRQILVHSCIYYKFDSNLITDHEYDALSRELAQLIQDYPKEFKASAYYEVYIGYDGCSGFDLPYNDPRTISKAIFMMNYKPKN